MPESSDRLVIRSDVAELGKLFAFVDRFCNQVGVEDDVRLRLRLLAEEVTVNVMNHGYRRRLDGRIEIALRSDGPGRIEIQVEDEAPAFDPLSDARAPQVDAALADRPVGGLGVHLVKSIAETLDYRFHDGRNILTATVGAAPQR